jgi:hypothetical protein
VSVTGAGLAWSLTSEIICASLKRFDDLVWFVQSSSRWIVVEGALVAGTVVTKVIVVAERDMAIVTQTGQSLFIDDNTFFINSNTSIGRERPCHGFCRLCMGRRRVRVALRSVFVVISTFWGGEEEEGWVRRVVSISLPAAVR